MPSYHPLIHLHRLLCINVFLIQEISLGVFVESGGGQSIDCQCYKERRLIILSESNRHQSNQDLSYFT